MDLSSSGRTPGRKKKEQVTLLSYANAGDAGASVKRRYANHSSQATPTSGVIPPVVAKKSEKFFRTLRKRSKSATRLNNGNNDSSDFRGSDLSLNSGNNYLVDNSSIPVTTNRIYRDRNSELKDKQDERVTLVGFASNLDLDSCGDSLECGSLSKRGQFLDFGGSAHNLNFSGSDHWNFAQSTPRRRISPKSFSTLKTSREVKMERERLRQERLSKLRDSLETASETSTASRRLFASNLVLAEDSNKFFEEAREKFLNGDHCTLNANELFSHFVRENQERFAHIVQQHRQQQQQQRSNASSTCLSSSSSSASHTSSRGRTLQLTTAFSSNSKAAAQLQQQQSESRVHHIEIQRESDEKTTQKGAKNIEIVVSNENCGSSDSHSDVGSSSSCSEHEHEHSNQEATSAKTTSPKESNSSSSEEDTKTEKTLSNSEYVQRSLSTSSRLSSSSSSGFSSIEGSNSTTTITATSSSTLTKLQQLQEKKNKSSFHHPTFANHFGFFGRVKNFNESSSYSNLTTTSSSTSSASFPRRGSAAELGGMEVSRGRSRISQSSACAKMRKVPVAKSKSVSADFRSVNEERGGAGGGREFR
jgi:hypothetical protein